MIERVVHLGFEVRVELVLDDGESMWAQVSRNEAEELELEEGQIVFVRPAEMRVFTLVVEQRRGRCTLARMGFVAVVGHTARDLVDGGPPRPGGVPLFAARALRALGEPGLVVTRCAEDDRALLGAVVRRRAPGRLEVGAGDSGVPPDERR